MTLATTWVRRGVAAQFPQKYQVDEAELNRISKLARLQLEDAQQDLQEAQNLKDEDDSEDEDSDSGVPTGASSTTKPQTAATDADDLKEYNLNDYDDDPVDDEGEKFSMFGNVGSLAYHAPHEKDPYIVLPEGEQDSEDEREELQIFIFGQPDTGGKG